MGGRAAEELCFGKERVTSGASNDIMVATKTARNMVKHFGFSDKVGVIHVDKESGGPTKEMVDQEVWMYFSTVLIVVLVFLDFGCGLNK